MCLAGMMAAAYVNGLQSQGVAATIKHFVVIDQEHERTAAESVMSDRALREIYLYRYVIVVGFVKTLECADDGRNPHEQVHACTEAG